MNPIAKSSMMSCDFDSQRHVHQQASSSSSVESIEWTPRRWATIDVLSDDVLLEVFHLYVDEAKSVNAWITLAYVCKRWQRVVSACPRRLGLQLLCGDTTPTRDLLVSWPTLPTRDLLVSWPTLPIIIKGNLDQPGLASIVDALEHNDRVCEIYLNSKASRASGRLARIAAAAREPFPVLTRLELSLNDGVGAILPDSFMGGSAPRLQRLDLFHVPFPTLPNLLLSATDLVYLRLLDIPNSGYISPEKFVICLPTMTRLETFHLGFRFSPHPPDQASEHPPQLSHAILPTLTKFLFRGNSKYIDDLVAQIDAPLLEELTVTFFNQLEFKTPHLLRFISRTKKLSTLNQADVLFHGDYVKVKFSSQRKAVSHQSLVLSIKCTDSEWQLSSLAQALRTPLHLPLPPLSTLERLDIFEGHHPRPHWHGDMEYTQWLELFQPFTSLRNLYLSEELAPHVVAALAALAALPVNTLQELIGDVVVGVLPMLQNLFIEGTRPSEPLQGAIGNFVAERQRSGLPIAVHHRESGNWVVAVEGSQ